MQHASTPIFFRFLAAAAAVWIVVACSGSESPDPTNPTGGDDAGAGADAVSSADTASSADGATTGTRHTVSATNFAYAPKALTIKVGDTVEWVFKSGTHTVTSGAGCKKDGRFDSGVHKSPFTFRHTFDTAGSFEYFCDYMEHCIKGQVGTITVE